MDLGRSENTSAGKKTHYTALEINSWHYPFQIGTLLNLLANLPARQIEANQSSAVSSDGNRRLTNEPSKSSST